MTPSDSQIVSAEPTTASSSANRRPGGDSRAVPGSSTASGRRLATTRSGAPEASTTLKRLLGRFHFSGVFWYRFHLFGVRVLPNWLLGATVLLFTSFFFVALGRVRRAVHNNLHWALGPAPGGLFGKVRRTFRTIHNLAWCLTETYEGLAGIGVGDSTLQDGEEVWGRLMDASTGFIMVTAHVGHWEVGSRSGRADRKVHIVREPEMDPEAQEFLSSLLEKTGGGQFEIHHSGVRDLALGARLLEALRRGEVVAIQGDRPGGGGRVHRVTLFDRPFDMPVGPAALARLANVPLVPVFVFRTGRSMSRVVVRQPIAVDREGPRQRALEEAVEALAKEVEWAIRTQPDQWFCFRDLWGKPPAGGSSGTV